MLDVSPLILAGGVGSRLKSISGDTPKPLVEVRGRPFITYLFDWIRSAGFSTAWVSVGYGAEMMIDELGDTCCGLNIKYSREYERLGTGGGVALAMQSIKSDAVVVMNGDSAVNTSLADFVKTASNHKTPALMAVKVSDTGRYGSLDIANNTVQTFFEKGRSGPGWINAGVYYLTRDVVEGLPQGPSSIEMDLMQSLTGHLLAYCCEADFIDIGTPSDFALAANASWVDALGKHRPSP